MNIQDSYNEWSDIYDTNINLTRDLDSTVTRSLLASRRFDTVLELGCGTGKNTVFFVEIGARIHALDFSEGMIQKAKEKVEKEKQKKELRKSRQLLRKLSIHAYEKQNSAGELWESLEHLNDDVEILCEKLALEHLNALTDSLHQVASQPTEIQLVEDTIDIFGHHIRKAKVLRKKTKSSNR